MATSSLFSSYQQELSSLISSLQDRPLDDDRYFEDLREAEALVGQLEIEARGNSSSETRSSVTKFKEEIRVLKSKAEKALLLSSADRSFESKYVEDDDVLERSAQTLLDSRRTLSETEALADSISTDLLTNRSTMLSTRDKLLHTGGLLGRAHRSLKTMQNRDVQRKLCAYGAVGFVILMFTIFLFKTIFGHGKTEEPVLTLRPTLSPTTIPPT